jgi:nitroreductase
MSKSTLKDLKTRRSIRSYKSEQITDEQLDQIFEAGTWAPTGSGSQSPVIVAVQNKTTINKLQKLNADVLQNPKAKPFYGAPTVHCPHILPTLELYSTNEKNGVLFN